MKPFRFRAAPLLDLRRRQYDSARGEFARLTEAVRVAGQRLELAERARDQAENDYLASMHKGATIEWLQRHRHWIVGQRRLVDEARRMLEGRRAEAARGAAAVRDAFMRVRILERLRERAKARHDHEVQREEIRDIDLLAVLQHARRIAEGGLHRDR
jgi:flagellar export protein FliJ